MWVPAWMVWSVLGSAAVALSGGLVWLGVDCWTRWRRFRPELFAALWEIVSVNGREPPANDTPDERRADDERSQHRVTDHGGDGVRVQ